MYSTLLKKKIHIQVARAVQTRVVRGSAVLASESRSQRQVRTDISYLGGKQYIDLLAKLIQYEVQNQP